MSNPTSGVSEKLVEVLLVDDHRMFREHLCELIRRAGGMRVCGEAESAAEAMDRVHESKPDVAIVDLTLRGSNGLHLVELLREEAPEVKILVLSMHDASLYGERAIRAGARGYLTKHQTSREVVETIHRILAGEICVSGDGQVGGGTEQTASGEIAIDATLTARELEVFAMLGRGSGTREIAETLGIGDSTVETYRFRIKEKLGLRSAAQLYVCAGNWLRERLR
jgi:DNA-binding NarL/FixJ family response regulator